MQSKTSDRRTPEGYSLHREPPAQGGKWYHRCDECEAELLVGLGGARQMIHYRECSRDDYWGDD